MKLIKKQVVLVLILIQVLMYVGCESDKTEENNGISEISIDKSYQCHEIENPPVDFQNCYSIDYMDNSEQYMVYIARQDGNTGKMIYSRNVFRENQWTTSDVLVDDVLNGGVYYQPHSDILYGTVCDVVEEKSNPNGYDESKWMGKMYKITSGGAVTTYSTENIDAIENYVWYGINENDNSIYYAPEEGKVLEYNYLEKEIENSWENVRCIDLCVTNRGIYGLESKDIAVIRVMEEGTYKPKEINIPKIENPLAMDIIDDIIFILNEDGIYTSDVTQPQKVEKIFDCQSATIDFEYLNDFQVVSEELDYVIYMSSFDDMTGKYVTNEIK